MKTLLFLIGLYTVSFGSITLTGTVTDTQSNPVPGAAITLTGISIPTIAESTVTSSTGSYQLTIEPLATYRLTVRKGAYNNIDSSFAVGNDNKVFDIKLIPIPVLFGTLHSGEVSGAWLPSGNPHRIIGNTIVKDSLYVAPGCSVVVEQNQTLTLAGKVVFGAKGGKRSYLNGDTILTRSGFIGTVKCSDTSASISVANTDINLIKFSIICQRIALDSIRNTIPIFDGPPADSIAAKDSAIISGSEILAFYKSSYYGAIEITANHVCIDNSILFFRMNTFVNAHNSVEINYSVITEITLNASAQCRKKICHSNIGIWPGDNTNILTLDYTSDTISNNIILMFSVNTANAHLNSSPFRYNIMGPPMGLIVTGLLSNVQKNINSDSCDIWFNISKDPQFKFDYQQTNIVPILLENNSPAFGAASDGTNIGYYQGSRTGSSMLNRQNVKTGKNEFRIQSLQPSKILIPKEYAGSSSTLRIYDLKGQCIFRSVLSGNKNIVPLQPGLSSGAYVGVLNFGGKAYKAKFILR
jgi:hypothetical protein